MEKRRIVFSTNLGGIPEPDCNVCRDLELGQSKFFTSIAITRLLVVQVEGFWGPR